MNFSFFESFSHAEAIEFLNNFLIKEKQAVRELIDEAESEGVSLDFTVSSSGHLLKWAVRKMRTVPRLPDENVPLWIRQTDDYKSGLFDFDESSKITILRSAYHLGQSFVNRSELLSWNTGNTETAHQNMPVVTGFQFGLELAPIMVVENLFARIIRQAGSDRDIDVALSYWVSKIPERVA